MSCLCPIVALLTFLAPGSARCQASRSESLDIIGSPGPATSVRLTGIVVDQTGAPIPGAHIAVSSPAWRFDAIADRSGAFAFELPEPRDVRVAIAAAGFTSTEQLISAADLARERRFVLPVATLAEQVSVTATRSDVAVAEAPATIAILPGDVLRSAPSPVLDDMLRQVPGFTLFRRSGSRTANPTTQGVSLGGLGASGASRALVLDDGIPLNDPFGGWVYWDRVPVALLDRVEVMQGGGSNLYGSGALGGVVNLVRRGDAPSRFDGTLSAGSLGTRQLSLSGGAQIGRWSGTAAGEALTTAGYVPVEPSERGRVDTPADSRHAALEATLRHPTLWSGEAFVRVSGFAETRGNGTPLQRNDTRQGQLAGGGQWQALAGGLEARAYASDQAFNQTFSAVSVDRQSERLTSSQHVPVRAWGSSAQWSRAIGRNVLVTGGEFGQVSGSTQETTPSSRATSYADRGGRQRTFALFAGDTITVSDAFTVNAGARIDRWQNDEGHDITWTAADLSPVVSRFAVRTEHAVSPRLSAVYRVKREAIVTGSVYRAFRAPTLNELYRSFRVGSIVTQANHDLKAEHLTGGEVAIRFVPARGRAFASARVFSLTMTDPVANVTLQTLSGTILRSRENLGSIRSQGVEFEGELRLSRGIAAHASYLFDRAVVAAFPADPRLVGRAVPQQPSHGFTARLQVAAPPLATFVVQGRWTGLQYDDDLNQFALGPYGVIDLFASRRATRWAEVFVAAENLTNRRYVTGMTPLTTLGWPRAVRVGLRVNAPHRQARSVADVGRLASVREGTDE